MAVSLLSSLMSPGLGVGCVLLLITNVTSLTRPSFQFQAHATPLPSWLTTPQLLAAVILRSPGFSPLLLQCCVFRHDHHRSEDFNVYTDDSFTTLEL